MTREASDLSTLEKSIKRLQLDPVLHIEEIQGVDSLEEYQRRICRAIAQYERVAIAACHDVGKSFTMAKIVLWFGSIFSGAKIITTAPTFNQVQRILWSEIRSGHSRSKSPLGGQLNLTEWKIDDDWFAIGFSPQKPAGSGENGQGTTSSFQGFHGEHVLVVFDEATGIPPSLWTQAEGLLTSSSVKFVAIGNPTSRQCEFFKCFSSPEWHKVYLSCFDSPNLQANGIKDMESLRAELDHLRQLPEEAQQTRLRSYKVVQPKLLSTSWVMGRALKWGVTHPLFLSKVLGIFPEEDEHVLMPLGAVELSQRREMIPDTLKLRSIGVDPARFGSDATVITVVEDCMVKPCKRLVKADTAQVTGEIVRLIKELPRCEREVVVIDGTGIGAGVVDQLKERQRERVIPSHIAVIERHFGESATGIPGESQEKTKEHYANFKAQIFVTLSESLKDDLILPPDAIYLEQLPTIIYSFDSKGRYVIESKDDYKKRTGLSSPDESDSLALANFGRFDTQGAGQFTERMAKSAGGTIAGGLSGGDTW